ncbi:hypothetical protein HanRHA438_Chr06g0260811 [Helianthus annuus]|nr:hypothetical protein HanRHA438_Chr06g0260811 [Helianthus annuus]
MISFTRMCQNTYVSVIHCCLGSLKIEPSSPCPLVPGISSMLLVLLSAAVSSPTSFSSAVP